MAYKRKGASRQEVQGVVSLIRLCGGKVKRCTVAFSVVHDCMMQCVQAAWNAKQRSQQVHRDSMQPSVSCTGREPFQDSS